MASNSELILPKELPKPTTPVSTTMARFMPSVLSVLGGGTDAAMFAASVIIACNDLPADANKASVAKAVLGAAYLQLPFGSALGYAYMIPFKSQIALVVGYRGFIELGTRSGFVKDLHADVVLQGEEFEYWKDETGPRMKHVPDPERVPGRNNILGAYCIYHTKAGGRGIRYVPRKEIDRVDKGKDVWNSAYPAMCMKTAIRRAAKEWRMTPQMAYAVQADERSESEESPELPPVSANVDEFLKAEEPKWTVPTGEPDADDTSNKHENNPAA